VPKILLVCALAIALACSLEKSSLFTVAAQDQNNDKFIQGIHAGDIKVITEAGTSGNKVFVPYLKEELKHRKRTREADTKLIEALRIALARLGDRQQLQQFWCSSLTEDPSTGLHPTLIFGQIGGWFSIQALDVFLTPAGQTHWKKAYSRFGGKYDNDVIQVPPTFDVLETLPKLVPKPPVGTLSSGSQLQPEQLVKIWQDWIATHKEELSNLQPTGEGVDISENGCRNGRPKEKHKD
jgi:hypothetical protein